jgi:hypothetical protein
VSLADALGLAAVFVVSALHTWWILTTPPQASARPRRSAELRCAYCHAGFEGPEAVTSCERCQTTHHAECFREHGRCSTYGCSPPALLSAPAASLTLPRA